LERSFILEISTPDRDFFRGGVESLIIGTPGGEMGIMRNTLPLVTPLDPGVLRIKQNGGWMEAANGEGFVEVTPEKVSVLTQSAEWPYEVDMRKVQAEIDAAQEVLRKAQSLKEYKMAKAQLARQFAKLKVKGRGLD
jgi:F-type H+-transporting ATPase subunit epsilon